MVTQQEQTTWAREAGRRIGLEVRAMVDHDRARCDQCGRDRKTVGWCTLCGFDQTLPSDGHTLYGRRFAGRV